MNNSKVLKKEGVKFLPMSYAVAKEVYASLRLLEVREFLRNLRYSSMYAPVAISVQKKGSNVKIKDKSGKLGVLASVTLEKTDAPQLIRIAKMGKGSLLTEEEALKCLRNSECTFSATEAVEICTRRSPDLNVAVRKCLSGKPLGVMSRATVEEVTRFFDDEVEFDVGILTRMLRYLACKIDDIKYETDDLRPSHYQNKFSNGKNIKVDKVVGAMEWAWDISTFEEKKLLNVLESEKAPAGLSYSYRQFLTKSEGGFEATRKLLHKAGLAGIDEFPLLRARVQIYYDLCNKNEHLSD